MIWHIDEICFKDWSQSIYYQTLWKRAANILADAQVFAVRLYDKNQTIMCWLKFFYLLYRLSFIEMM